MMRYLVEIRIDGKIRTYRIDAADETQVSECLKLRLPPYQRENVIIDSISPDTSALTNDEPFGVYLN